MAVFVLVERDGTLFFTDNFDEFLLRAADARASRSILTVRRAPSSPWIR